MLRLLVTDYRYSERASPLMDKPSRRDRERCRSAFHNRREDPQAAAAALTTEQGMPHTLRHLQRVIAARHDRVDSERAGAGHWRAGDSASTVTYVLILLIAYNKALLGRPLRRA
jgi:hypothetical protein